MEKTNFTPVQDWLLVRLHEVEKETSSGFVVSDKKLTPNKAEVIRAAEGTQAKEGDTIFLEKQFLSDIKIDGELLHAIRERHIIGIISK